MARRLEFSYRGNLRETHQGLVRTLDRHTLTQTLALRVRAEGRPTLWAVLVMSYAMAWLTLMPAGLSMAFGLTLIHAVYIPLFALVWRLTARSPRLAPDRVRRVQSWLDRARKSMPDSASIDIRANLTASGCGGKQGQCGDPWMTAYVFLEDGSTIEIRVTDGRACPLVRLSVPAGKVLVELDLACGDTIALATLAQHIGEQGDAPGLRTRCVEPDGTYRLRWVLEQDLSAMGDEIPLWPLTRLAAMCTAMRTGGALPAPEPLSAGPAWRWSPAPLGLAGIDDRQEVRLALHPSTPASPWSEPGALTASNVPSPAVGMLSMGMVLNCGIGALGLALQSAPSVTATAMATGVQSSVVGIWSLFLGLGLTAGLMTLAPWPLSLWQRRRPLPPRHTGALDVHEEGLRLLPAPEVEAIGIDFARPFSAVLTREPPWLSHDARTRVFLTLIQRGAEGVSRAQLSARLTASVGVSALPTKIEIDCPEMDEASFRWLWQTLRQISEAHGTPLPSIG